jgi:hypothetical protein
MIKTMPDKIATAVGYCTSGSLICRGAIAQWLHGLDWNLIAVIGGFVIGAATFFPTSISNAADKAYEKALARGIVSPPHTG